VARVLRGRVDAPEPGIVDVRATSTRAPLLTDGERVVVLLRPAPALSYLTKHLPGGAHFDVVGGRDGVVPVGSDAEVEVVERILAEPGADAETVRRVAAAELASGNPRLAADALAELRRAAPLRPLSRADVEALGKALADRRVEPITRAGLMQLVGAARAVEAAPALATAVADTPAVLEALFAARADLGVAGREQLAPQLGSRDAHVRAAAVRALARLDQPGVVAEVGRYATSDPDAGVRLAAIDALGATKRTDAVPFLATTFDSSETRFQHRSAQAMLEIGGPAVDEALVDLALRGKTPKTRRYGALILLMQHGRDAEVVRRIERSNPAPEVRELLEKGLQKPD
jgi:HEAT repeat protein